MDHMSIVDMMSNRSFGNLSENPLCILAYLRASQRMQ